MKPLTPEQVERSLRNIIQGLVAIAIGALVLGLVWH